MSSDHPLDDIFIGKMTRAWAQNSQIPAIYELQTESTNLLSKNHGLAENDFMLFLTDLQTKGKGRGTNTWNSDKGSGLLSTWSFYLNAPPESSFTSRIGLAVWRALTSTWSFIPFALKAPNDIYVHNKKVAGILVETVTMDQEVTTHIGIGINVLKSPSSEKNAGHLIQALGKETPLLGTDWVRFLDRLFFELTDAVGMASDSLSTTDRANLRQALNLFELKEYSYDDVLENAELIQNGVKIPWFKI